MCVYSGLGPFCRGSVQKPAESYLVFIALKLRYLDVLRTSVSDCPVQRVCFHSRP